MNGAAPTFTITSGTGATGGLEGIGGLPSEFAAISKAVTGAYLSSEGNAFSTRTASQIIQQNFDPGEKDKPYVVVDGNLITGRDPLSADLFGDTVVKKLSQ